MFLYAVPNISSNYNGGTIQILQQVLVEQQENLTILCTIAQYLKGSMQSGLESSDVIKYNQKMQLMTNKQMNRYDKIDHLINTNIIQMKKGETTDNSVLIYGKEVRKIESGIRTLKLFVHDAINMLDQNVQIENRSEERLRYFEGRSTEIEGEIITLSKQLALI